MYLEPPALEKVYHLRLRCSLTKSARPSTTFLFTIVALRRTDVPSVVIMYMRDACFALPSAHLLPDQLLRQ